jgi:hypothetical protein
MSKIRIGPLVTSKERLENETTVLVLHQVRKLES